jgi:hypothetical protein
LHVQGQCRGNLVDAGREFGGDAVAEELGDVQGFALGHRSATGSRSGAAFAIPARPVAVFPFRERPPNATMGG